MIVYLYKKPKYDCFSRNKTLTLHIDLYIFWRKPRLSLEQINDPDVESCKNCRKAIKSLDHTIPIYIFILVKRRRRRREGKGENNINIESYNNDDITMPNGSGIRRRKVYTNVFWKIVFDCDIYLPISSE